MRLLATALFAGIPDPPVNSLIWPAEDANPLLRVGPTFVLEAGVSSFSIDWR